MSTIKPCPFCGKQNDVDDLDVLHQNGSVWIEESDGFIHYCHRNDIHLYENKTHGFCYEINCPEHHWGCGANITGNSKEEVIAKWNRRLDAKIPHRF